MEVDSVIDIVRSFIDAKASESRKVTDGRSGEILVNEQIFQLQSAIELKIKENELKMKLDTSIRSDGIMESFWYNREELKPYAAKDYALPFFLSFIKHYEVSNEVRHYIDLFVQDHAEELRYTDIVITNTGATRCKTNIRFATDILKSNYLLIKKHNEKRVMVPSIWGLLYCVTHLKLDEMNEMEKLSRAGDYLYPPSIDNMISLLRRHYALDNDWLRQFENVLAELVDKCFEVSGRSYQLKLSRKTEMENEIVDLLLDLETTEEASRIRKALINECRSLLK